MITWKADTVDMYFLFNDVCRLHCIDNVRFGFKVCQIAPNWTNPGLFQIRFQYILAKMHWNLIWKSLQIFHILGQSDTSAPLCLQPQKCVSGEDQTTLSTEEMPSYRYPREAKHFAKVHCLLVVLKYDPKLFQIWPSGKLLLECKKKKNAQNLPMFPPKNAKNCHWKKVPLDIFPEGLVQIGL